MADQTQIRDPRFDYDPLPTGASWTRQDYETDAAYQAFAIYRDMGPFQRSLRAAQAAYTAQRRKDGRSSREDPATRPVTGYFAQWATKNAWVDRARAFDQWTEKQHVLAHQAEVTEMRKRHAAVASSLMSKVVQRLQTFTETDAAKLTPSDLVRLTDSASRLERLSRGEPTEIVEDTNTVTDAARTILDTEDIGELAARLEEKLGAVDEARGA